ncbi:hypothetical protein V5799_027799 [Amblyomma americanum]|uniref:Uncharacterized protein n=1 Tax=Amblyomma americanum TaxID=6943 RepID=A0AAQ4DEP4_AMBAM
MYPIRHRDSTLTPRKTTRVGNSVSRDTCPDLTLVKNCLQATWCDTGESLGSDRFIVSCTIPGVKCREPFGKAKIVKLDKWGEETARLPDEDVTDIEA